MTTNLYNRAAEETLIGYLVKGDTQAVDEIMTRLTAEDFFIANHRYVFIIANGLWKSRKAVDIITIYENLKDVKTIEFETGDALKFLSKFTDNILGDYATAIESVKQNGVYRRAKAAVAAFSDALEESPKQSIDTLIARLTALDDTAETKIKTLVNSLADALCKLQSPKPTADVKTGFGKFDNNIQFINKEVAIIAARPATGKSAFAAQLAANMAIQQGRRVAFFSLEMSDVSIALRLIANESGCDLKNLFRKQYDADSIFAAYGRLSTENMFMFDNVYAIEDITKYCRLLKARGGLDCVVIDYLQLITTKERFGNTNDRVSHISRSIKLIASELDIPVIALSQMSRDIEKREDKNPKMSDVRDSGAIEQDASVLIFFTEDKDKSEMYGDPEKIKFIKAFVSKNRNGVTGYLNFKFTANLMRFEEVDNDGKLTGGTF